MQFQIEHNSYVLNSQFCYLCQHKIERKEAIIIICNERGESYGEACPHCIAKGYAWMQNQFQQLCYKTQISTIVELAGSDKLVAV